MINRSSCNPSPLDEVPPSYEEATGIPVTKSLTENTTIPIPVAPDTTSQDSSFLRMYSEIAKYDPRAFVYTICMMITVLLITLLAAIRISRCTTTIRGADGPYHDYNNPN